MSMTLILMFVLIGCLFLVTKKHKLSITFFVLAILSMAGIGSGRVPQFLLTGLQEAAFYEQSPQWKKHNAIIVLGSGTVRIPFTNATQPAFHAYSRILKAATLYFDCKQVESNCDLILSGGDPRKVGDSEAEVAKKQLLALGVDLHDIILEGQSNNTYQNAEFVDPLLAKQAYETLILVSSGLHLKRALLYFSQFNRYPIPVAADYFRAHFSYLPISLNFTLNDAAMHEYQGMLRFYIYNLMGWNKRPS